MPKKINLLTADTIVKIAAGEIIENPASIIKELVENSIDAGANKIVIKIEKNGKDLIQITDNGHGFDSKDLDIAFKRHSTSKIESIDDLDMSDTLGFRGEALSSIAYVSDLSVVTKSTTAEIGHMVKVNHSGEVTSKEEAVVSNGSTVIAKNLFGNIPVRDQFLKSKNYQISETNNIVTKLALSRLDLSFEYYRDDRLILRTDPKLGEYNNIYSILGGDIANGFHYIEWIENDYKIYGYISDNKLYRSNRSNQFLFVNGRSVKDNEITSSIESTYKSIIPLNRFPIFILFIEIKNQYLDINIHPKKDVVRLSNIDEIKLFIKENLEIDLKNIISTPSIVKTEKKKETIFIKNRIHEDSNDNITNDSNLYHNKEKTLVDIIDLADNLAEENIDVYNKTFTRNDISCKYDQKSFINKKDNVEEIDDHKSESLFKNGYRFIGQFMEKYVLLEDRVEEVIYFLDQHAAHERINYEKLKDDYEKSEVKSQLLLEGYIVELGVSDFDNIISKKEELKDIGITIDEFGYNSIILRSLPIGINIPDIDEFIKSIINISRNKKNIYEINPYEIMKIACSMSIKSGQVLNFREVDKLIEKLKEADFPLSCPHGRPTIIKITNKELDKEFNRIQ